MRRHQITFLLIALLTCGLMTGCGGGREKGKNSDFDRPKGTQQK